MTHDKCVICGIDFEELRHYKNQARFSINDDGICTVCDKTPAAACHRFSVALRRLKVAIRKSHGIVFLLGKPRKERQI